MQPSDNLSAHDLPTHDLPAHIAAFKANADEVLGLHDFHSKLASVSVDKRAVLNKSSIVLLVACWEAYIEDLAAGSFGFLLENCPSPLALPPKLRGAIARELRARPNENDIWNLAGDGWRDVACDHRAAVIDRHVGKLNTPRPAQIDGLFEALLGLKNLSGCWKQQERQAESASDRLEQLVTLRGEIAHHVRTSRIVGKDEVREAANLVAVLAGLTSNRIREYLQDVTDREPWRKVNVSVSYESQTGDNSKGA